MDHLTAKPATAQSLLIIDGMNLVRRVYEANPAPDGAEKVDMAIRNSLGSFRRALREHPTTHAVAIFDNGGVTWRHQRYPDYKAGRKPIFPPLRQAMPAFWEMLNTQFGLRSVAHEGIEADDIIATVANKWRERSAAPATVLSTDKDLLQLVPRDIQVWDHFTGEHRDETWVARKFGIKIDQLIDYLALVGDDTDGIPGVAKVGPKTAVRLLEEHGTLAAILGAAPTISTALGRRLVEQADRALLSYDLVQLRFDSKVGLAWNDMVMSRRQTPPPTGGALPYQPYRQTASPTSLRAAT